jgi:hypothetical protein
MKHPKNENSKWDNYFPNEIEYGTHNEWRDNLTNAFKIIFSWEST